MTEVNSAETRLHPVTKNQFVFPQLNRIYRYSAGSTCEERSGDSTSLREDSKRVGLFLGKRKPILAPWYRQVDYGAQTTAERIGAWQAGNRHHWGTYHLTCRGETSWFGFASAIAERLRAAGKPCARLRPIPSSEYPTPARRPLNSRLDGERLEQEWQIRLPDWRAALDACLRAPQAVKR
ncbi:RmlD substrate binding domain-containing protein [Ectopseudomonas guguanensis]|uniref:dTDP-4-dehydrorhamnose reductase n=1 Tax=Ectopseudomonas guguanensis TaxID=1198456 RepID=A0A1H0TQG1_9GAMM|nr:RmlD substrate binding domain-containing protein [Pseudomonas guguanensis]